MRTTNKRYHVDCGPAALKGRNGYEYTGRKISPEFYVMGRWIVKAANGKVTETICRATKENVENHSTF